MPKEKSNRNVLAEVREGDSLSAAVEEQLEGPPELDVSLFDYSVENHFKAVDKVSKLCGEPDFIELDKGEMERWSSSVTFLREWRDFNYQPKIIRFACQSKTPYGKDVGVVNLPQFSAAAVPKMDSQNGNTLKPESSKDFVINVGGSVWALDWCPRFHQEYESHIKSEFIAVAAHPPESSYHKIGASLTGRGVIQIWTLLSLSMRKEDVVPQVKKKQQQNSRSSEMTKINSTQPKKPRGRPRKSGSSDMAKVDSTQPKKPRGRPRKNPINELAHKLDCSNQLEQPHSMQFPEDSSQSVPADELLENVHNAQCNKKRKAFNQEVSTNGSVLMTSANDISKGKKKKECQAHGNYVPLLMLNDNEESATANPNMLSSCEQDLNGSRENIDNCSTVETNPVKAPIPEDANLPRVVLCLAHNGKVAWDVKWRPHNSCEANSKNRMGYLAVLLGSGSLEVWEVPFPRTIKAIYSSCQTESTDPRFIKLEPVFKCLMLKCGDRQSIPLALEWSTSPPHDLILAGCHDGVVAVWKFCTAGLSNDTSPLLCFRADTVPIRALAWAPRESDSESENVFVTAGHRGLKFWDIRDPFRPLWDLNPVQRVIYSVDWLPDPRCVIVSFDDGTLRILSLVKAAYDVPVTGKAFVGTQQQGLHSYYCSSFAIWSVQASPVTGMVAYCCEDGHALYFQLTARAVENDRSRNRAPHFLCGSLAEEESALTVITPLPGMPFPMKKSLNEWGNAPRTIRGFLSVSNQEKRAKEQMTKCQPSDDQPLALCYGNDPGNESESDDTMLSHMNKKTPKSNTKIKRDLKNDLALACRDEEPENCPEEHKAEAVEDIDFFPPKTNAMHRVRWNMNKGSERWLCYGGAGGIVRCQEIDVPLAHK